MRLLMIKRDVEAVPFDEVYKVVSTAAITVKNKILSDALADHERNIGRKIKALYANSEYSYEGNIEEDFPFSPPDDNYIQEQMQLAKKEAFAKVATKHNFKANFSWLMPQLTSYIAKLPLPRNSAGKVDSYEYFQSFGANDFLKGIYIFCTHSVRGDLIPTQYSIESRPYSALVPLLMMPHKKFNNVQYSDWSIDGINKVLDPQLFAAIQCDIDKSAISKADLLQMRQAGMQYRTGKMAGTYRNPATTHKIYGVPAPFNKMPWLASVMLFQIWVAHPNHRSNLMILDWEDWDNLPDSLIDAEPIKTAPLAKRDDWE